MGSTDFPGFKDIKSRAVFIYTNWGQETILKERTRNNWLMYTPNTFAASFLKDITPHFL